MIPDGIYDNIATGCRERYADGKMVHMRTAADIAQERAAQDATNEMVKWKKFGEFPPIPDETAQAAEAIRRHEEAKRAERAAKPRKPRKVPPPKKAKAGAATLDAWAPKPQKFTMALRMRDAEQDLGLGPGVLAVQEVTIHAPDNAVGTVPFLMKLIELQDDFIKKMVVVTSVKQ